MSHGPPGDDPRLNPRPEPGLALDELQPIVGRPASRIQGWMIVGAFAAAAILLFLVLNNHRARKASASLVTPAGEVAAVAPPEPSPPPPLKLASPAPVEPRLPPPQPAPPPMPSQPPPLAPGQTGAPADAIQHEHAPTMVVDLGGAPAEQPPRAQAPAAAPGATGAAPAPAPTGAGSAGNADDQFAQRVGDERPARSRAVTMTHLDTLVPQGVIIPAALETAIDSDLTGYTRAVVSRDVLSFDGKNVLIPRGSRLIGQYKSAVSLGATRAFVIWTRIIRSDGVSIQIGSPGTDTLGRGGLTGEVDRHFFTRFGGSILLSVLNAGVAAVARTPSTNITIGTPGAAVGAAGAIQPDAIPPTIKVAQGAAVNIFVARDLDFSDVAAVK